MTKTSIINKIRQPIAPIKSLSEYIEVVSEIRKFSGDRIWFRGHSKLSHKLIPSIYRNDTWYNKEYSFSGEFGALQKFRRESMLHYESEYELLELMQHYGLPTRMMDWTESSLISLFFAINKEQSQISENPVVWTINPLELNKLFHNEPLIFYFFGNHIHDKIPQYLYPRVNKDDLKSELSGEFLPEFPISIMPSFNNERIISQKSVFILFGKNQTALEEIPDRNLFKLSKIEIDRKYCNKIFEDLILAGIDFRTVYPDIEGLVKETKRMFGMNKKA